MPYIKENCWQKQCALGSILNKMYIFLKHEQKDTNLNGNSKKIFKLQQAKLLICSKHRLKETQTDQLHHPAVQLARAKVCSLLRIQSRPEFFFKKNNLAQHYFLLLNSRAEQKEWEGVSGRVNKMIDKASLLLRGPEPTLLLPSPSAGQEGLPKDGLGNQHPQS